MFTLRAVTIAALAASLVACATSRRTTELAEGPLLRRVDLTAYEVQPTRTPGAIDDDGHSDLVVCRRGWRPWRIAGGRDLELPGPGPAATGIVISEPEPQLLIAWLGASSAVRAPPTRAWALAWASTPDSPVAGALTSGDAAYGLERGPVGDLLLEDERGGTVLRLTSRGRVEAAIGIEDGAVTLWAQRDATHRQEQLFAAVAVAIARRTQMFGALGADPQRAWRGGDGPGAGPNR